MFLLYAFTRLINNELSQVMDFIQMFLLYAYRKVINELSQVIVFIQMFFLYAYTRVINHHENTPIYFWPP